MIVITFINQRHVKDGRLPRRYVSLQMYTQPNPTQPNPTQGVLSELLLNTIPRDRATEVFGTQPNPTSQL